MSTRKIIISFSYYGGGEEVEIPDEGTIEELSKFIREAVEKAATSSGINLHHQLVVTIRTICNHPCTMEPDV